MARRHVFVRLSISVIKHRLPRACHYATPHSLFTVYIHFTTAARLRLCLWRADYNCDLYQHCCAHTHKGVTTQQSPTAVSSFNICCTNVDHLSREVSGSRACSLVCEIKFHIRHIGCTTRKRNVGRDPHIFQFLEMKFSFF